LELAVKKRSPDRCAQLLDCPYRSAKWESQVFHVRRSSAVDDEDRHSTQTGYRAFEIDGREAVLGERSRGRNPSAASRCMNSSGDITK
jgi:hypothetical protein